MVARFKIIAFLSTLSLRRATNSRSQQAQRWPYFYPRSPCGERPVKAPCMQVIFNISIHALLAESDSLTLIIGFLERVFLSTLSLRRATCFRCCAISCITISIHALLAESDHKTRNNCIGYCDFYPRSPCGERHLRVLDGSKSSIISIHALLAESDGVTVLGIQHKVGISIHALLAESDLFALLRDLLHHDFYPRSPCGERRISSVINNVINDFYPRSPCGERRAVYGCKV